MRPGQIVPIWLQNLFAGRLCTPREIVAASRAEVPDAAQAADRFFDIPDDGPGFQAPARLKAPGHFLTTSWLRQSERADWAFADPRLMYWSACFVEAARKKGIPLYVHTALRGREEQERVNKAGHSKAGYPRSAHNIGEAVDVVHGVFHWDMTPQEWAYLHVFGSLVLDRVNAQLPKADKLALTWGGNFKSLYDPAHWEIADYRTRLRALPSAPAIHKTPTAIIKQWPGPHGWPLLRPDI